jgi:hypothetical protein
MAAVEQAPGPRAAAVHRITRIELERFTDAVKLSWNCLLEGKAGPCIESEVKARLPIIHWSTATWLEESLGLNTPGVWCPTLKKWGLHAWQWHINSKPELWPALRSILPQIMSQVRFRARRSPLSVFPLMYNSLLVYTLALLRPLPGPQKKLIQRVWPRIVEELSSCIESNHQVVLKAWQGGEAESESRSPLDGLLRAAKSAATIVASVPLPGSHSLALVRRT